MKARKVNIHRYPKPPIPQDPWTHEPQEPISQRAGCKDQRSKSEMGTFGSHQTPLTTNTSTGGREDASPLLPSEISWLEEQGRVNADAKQKLCTCLLQGGKDSTLATGTSQHRRYRMKACMLR